MWRSSMIRSTPRAAYRGIIQTRQASSSAGGGGGFAKTLLWTTGLAAAGAGGTLGYAWYDPEFRKKVEDQIPQTKEVFSKTLGDTAEKPKLPIDFKQVKDAANRVVQTASNLLPAKKESKEEPSTSPFRTSDSKPVETKPEKPKVEVKKEPEVKRDSEVQKRLQQREEEAEEARQRLEAKLQTLLTKVEDAVKAAVDAKLKSVSVIEKHTKLVRNAVDEQNTTDIDKQWKSANETLDIMNESSKTDQKHEDQAKSLLDNLRRTINDGRSSKSTSEVPLLTIATEALGRWKYQLDEAISRVNQARTEAKIIGDYKKLIQEGQEQFLRELKSILPNVDINAGNLSKEELNHLLAHAHVRVGQLRRQLAEQQLREQQHIEQALDRQKAENSKLSDDKVEISVAKIRADSDLDMRAKLQEAHVDFEEELRKQLRRQAAAHSEHLEEVLTAQKAQLEAKFQHDLNLGIMNERDQFSRNVAFALARLEAIEAALEGRSEQDKENQRAKELWLACQQLKKSVLQGREGGRDEDTRRKALLKEIALIKETGSSDPFVNTLVNTISNEAIADGVYTQEDLVERFAKVKKLCRRTALIGDNGGTLVQYFLSTLQSFFIFDRVKPEKQQLEEVDVANIDTFGILWRASYYVEQKDLDSAIRLMLLLKGEPARLASDWIKDARLHLETRRAAELLLAHASAVSMRTMY